MTLSFPTRRSSDLSGHFSIRKATAPLNQPVRQCRLAIVDVGDNRKITDCIKVGHGSPIAASNRAVSISLAPRPFGASIALNKRERLMRHVAVIGSRSEEHTSELQSLMRISYAVFCLKKKKRLTKKTTQ